MLNARRDGGIARNPGSGLGIGTTSAEQNATRIPNGRNGRAAVRKIVST